MSYITKPCKPPINRVRWHDVIDKEQEKALRSFSSTNEEVGYYVTQSITKRIDELQCRIEKDSTIKDQQKVGYLRGVSNLLNQFIRFYSLKQFTPSHFPGALDAFELAMIKDGKGESIERIIDQSSYDVGNLILTSNDFKTNPGYKTAQQIQLKKYCILHPDQIFIKLKANPDLPYPLRDSLIKFAARKYPKRLYDFASEDTRLGYAIRNVDDPFIRTISKMAKSGGNGQLLFPFLDNLISEKITDEEIKAVMGDDAKYYKLLVKTKLDYVSRSVNGDSILSMGVLDTMLQRKGRDYFVKEINALHESPNAVRFRILNQLNAQELYYLVIAGERDMYTSSYVQGIYPLMMQRIGNKGDSLLMSVKFDRFKKFIKVAAGYNTLSNFLASFPDKEKAQVVMTAFVNNLEKSTGLEDGVDVADSYASVAETIKPVAEDMLNNVKANLDRNIRDNNKRGIVMYNLLYKLFLSADTAKGIDIDLSREFGIPSVYSVNYQSLIDDSSGKVVIQVFFYGDKDGLMNWSRFVPEFSNGNWKKTDDTKYWVSYTSVKGKPIVVYANKWMNDDKQPGELDKAQASLNEYLDKKSIQPTIVVHRGHSYWAPYTIEQIKPAAKIVLLGSCGGYNLIHSVLSRAPDAQIIASKQTGKVDINQPFINIMNEKLRNGNNIEWIPFWNEFKAKAGRIDGFEDYIPPYKNLGVIFIKAYNSSMGENEL
ncbi:MAG: hypothetical protein ACJ749_19250 [Flavisolibacter sp.]